MNSIPVETIERRYFNAIIQAIDIANTKARGDMGTYENKLFRFAVTYHSLFLHSTTEDADRLATLNALSDILPEFFQSSFTDSGNWVQ